MKLSKNAMIAIYLGTLCSVSYLGVYFARNLLSAVTPQMVAGGGYTKEYIGSVFSIYSIWYAVGQLINGAIGDKIKAKYMVGFGLFLAAATNYIFSLLPAQSQVATYVYGLAGFFLSMIYGPLAKVVAENTEPPYTTRCSVGYTFASFLGSPMAGICATFLSWQGVFAVGSLFMATMAVMCFLVFHFMECKGIIKYNRYAPPKKIDENTKIAFIDRIKVLLQRQIIKFTLIAAITGIVRTTVVFWLSTYISEYLGYEPKDAAKIYSVATFFISMTTFIAIFIYERLKRNMDLTILLVFSSAAIGFLIVYFVQTPLLNIIFLIISILSSNCASSMLWSRYCPSLRDTGMVSSATGFLDFTSYTAASVTSTLFANAVSTIGWGNLILVWDALMVLGVIIALPYDKLRKKLPLTK